MYGLPKLHKVPKNFPNPPFRPVVSSIGTYNYQLAKFLSDILTPLIPSNHCTSDSFTFVEELKQVSCHNKFMISFDVESLFTNIPLNEVIELAIDLIFEKTPDIDITKPKLRKLFVFATKQTNFTFDGIMYDQIDGVAMGSPLAPALANLFLGFHENNWLNDPKAGNVIFYKRYVDDIFCLFPNDNCFIEFFDFINSSHDNIRFTYEKQLDNTLPFLDVLIKSYETSFDTTTFYKKTYTGLLTHFSSFTSMKYKVGLVRTLVDRAFKINSSYLNFHKNLEKIKHNLQKNGFPLHFIERIIQKFMSSKFSENEERANQNSSTRFYKLPFLGESSSNLQSRFRKLVSRCCTEDTDLKLIFVPSKILAISLI